MKKISVQRFFYDFFLVSILDVMAAHTQYPQKLMCAGIIGAHVLGPVVTGERYVELLTNAVSGLLNDMYVDDEIWYMHDGTSAHNYRPATAFLIDAFPGRVIGTRERPLA